MRLAHRLIEGQVPSEAPLVVLHGHLGSSRNWMSVGRGLARYGDVVLADLRNHGASPHGPGMSFEELAGDVAALLEELDLRQIVLMGHSLGGKVAMRLACDRAQSVRRLYVLDIAVRAYRPDPTVLDALLGVDLARVEQRQDAERQLEGAIPDLATRRFLLTNLSRTEDGDGFRWTVPLELLHAGLEEIYRSPLSEGDRYPGPTDFIVGGDSSYFAEADLDLAQQHFPRAELTVLEGVGHNVHVEGGEAFLAAVGDWSRREGDL